MEQRATKKQPAKDLWPELTHTIKFNEEEPLILKRSEAYIGVLIDDLVNKGTQEPYRMFTSRAEYRILLRQDNADLRLTETGHNIGLADDSRLDKMLQKKGQINQLQAELSKSKVSPESINSGLEALGTSPVSEKITLSQLLKRPQIEMKDLKNLNGQLKDQLQRYPDEILQQAEINIKYDSYIEREQQLVEKLGNLENYRIRSDFDYDMVKALSSESREKLKKIRPETVGQASRISGVSPADVSVLTVYMGK